MSARPDLTTEELIRWCEECAHAINPPSYAALPYYRAIAQRLRSERPAVTPEMRVYGVDVPILPPTTASAIPRRPCYCCEAGFVDETNIRGRTFDYRGERLTLDVDVRVPVCDQCGEIYFRGEATQVFSAAMERLRKPT